MVCDQQLQLCWANAFALSTYPTLAMADGLETLLPANLLIALRQQAEEAPCQELQAPTMAGSTRLIFTPLEGGCTSCVCPPQTHRIRLPLGGGEKVSPPLPTFSGHPSPLPFGPVGSQ